jgi:hypothetical protein
MNSDAFRIALMVNSPAVPLNKFVVQSSRVSPMGALQNRFDRPAILG